MRSKLLTNIGDGFKKRQGTVLTITTIGGTLAAVYFAYKDGPKLMAKLDELKTRDNVTTLEKAKEIAPIVSRTVIATTVSIGSAALNHKQASDTIRSLTDMLALKNVAEESFRKYTEEEIGTEAAQAIETKVARDIAEHSYPCTYNNQGTRVYETGFGQDLFFDSLHQFWFRSDINHMKSVVNELNQEILSSMDVSLNELYNGWNVPAVDDLSDPKFWSLDETGLIDISYYASLDDTDHAYTLITYNKKPRQARKRY